MNRSSYRLSPAADQDIADILRGSRRMFGPLQAARYAGYLEKAFQTLGGEPLRPGSRARDSLGAEVRSYHLELAAGRLGAASHVVFYAPAILKDGGSGVVIIRVLHETMDPALHISGDQPLTSPSSS